LYNNSIIHRDIKPANILIHEGVAKLTDFGFARVIDSGMEDQGAFSKVGTPLYMSPQILNDQKFSSKCDIWSLGMMLYEMLYGKTPWTANSPY
jgi:serine/threonine protein kinase